MKEIICHKKMDVGEKIQPCIHNWHYFTNSTANIKLVTYLNVVTNIKEYNLCCGKKKQYERVIVTISSCNFY